MNRTKSTAPVSSRLPTKKIGLDKFKSVMPPSSKKASVKVMEDDEKTKDPNTKEDKTKDNNE